MNQDQDREAGQAARCPDLDGEEIGGGEHVPVGDEKVPTSPAFLAFGRPALQFLVLTVAGWVNRRQEDLIDHLREENCVLRDGRLKSAGGRDSAARISGGERPSATSWRNGKRFRRRIAGTR